MMEGQQFLQQFMYAQQCELWDIQSLQPSQFVQRVCSFPFTGFEQRLIGYVHQAMYDYKGERAIMKYIYIIDKLIKLPNFKLAIQNAIVEIYCDLFMFLLAQKCQNQIDQLKILRKYWVGKIHPFLLTNIKEKILLHTNIDVDGSFKHETINKIRDYYTNKLQLTPEEIQFHLPYTHKVNPPRYPVDNKPIYALSAPNYNHNYSGNNGSLRYGLPPAPAAPLYNPFMGSGSVGGSGQPMQPIQIAHIINNDVNQKEELKRKRLASEETRVALNMNVSGYDQPKARKIVHKNQVIIDYKFMLSKFKQMNPYNCRECGLTFTCSDTHEIHKNQHFKEKLHKIEKNYRNHRKYALSNTDAWINPQQDLNLTNDQFCIAMPSTAFCSRRCDFCCAQINIQFRADRWVYVNAITVKIAGKHSILHKSCQLALDVPNELEEQLS